MIHIIMVNVIWPQPDTPCLNRLFISSLSYCLPCLFVPAQNVGLCSTLVCVKLEQI